MYDKLIKCLHCKLEDHSAKLQQSPVTVQSHSIQRLQCKVTAITGHSAFSSYSAKLQQSLVTVQSHSIQRLQCKVKAITGHSAKLQQSPVTVQSHSIQRLQCKVTAITSHSAKVTAFRGYSTKLQHSAVTAQSYKHDILDYKFWDQILQINLNHKTKQNLIQYILGNKVHFMVWKIWHTAMPWEDVILLVTSWYSCLVRRCHTNWKTQSYCSNNR